jgi:hypothetical protein
LAEAAGITEVAKGQAAAAYIAEAARPGGRRLAESAKTARGTAGCCISCDTLSSARLVRGSRAEAASTSVATGSSCSSIPEAPCTAKATSIAEPAPACRRISCYALGGAGLIRGSSAKPATSGITTARISKTASARARITCTARRCGVAAGIGWSTAARVAAPTAASIAAASRPRSAVASPRRRARVATTVTAAAISAAATEQHLREGPAVAKHLLSPIRKSTPFSIDQQVCCNALFPRKCSYASHVGIDGFEKLDAGGHVANLSFGHM